MCWQSESKTGFPEFSELHCMTQFEQLTDASESSIEAQAEWKFTESAHEFSQSAFQSYDHDRGICHKYTTTNRDLE